MIGVPSIPYKIETTMRVGETLRREMRNATTLPQAYDIMERELRKPTTRRAEIMMILHTTERRGGLPEG